MIAEATVKTNGPQLKARYTRGKDFTELLSIELANGTKGYYVQERHRDIIRIESETGNVLNEYTYDIWGNPIVQNETIANPFRYSGEWVEEKTNLQYLKARWYEAKLGRFISEDPVEGIFTEPLSLNRYTYAENNPLKYVDPSGNIVGTLIDVGFLIYDTAKFIKEPSKANAGNVGLSFASALIPGVTGGSAAAKAVAKGKDKAKNVVYTSINGDDVVQYVGITNNYARRAAEHLRDKKIDIRPLMKDLSRSDARAVEQALIEIHGLQKNGGTLINKINSISSKNSSYAKQLERGYELLKSIGYK